jgi:hypothetical protein
MLGKAIYVLIITFISALNCLCFAQSQSDEVSIKKATGETRFMENMTLDEAKTMALQNAKADALKQAEDRGFQIRDATNFIILYSEKSEIIVAPLESEDELYTLSVIAPEAFVDVDEKNIKYTPENPRVGDMITASITNVKVLVFAPSDITLKIEGLNETHTYMEGDDLSFSVTITEDSYLRVFAFDTEKPMGEGSCLHPVTVLIDETNKESVDLYNDTLLKAYTSYAFPLPKNNRLYHMPLSLSNPKKKSQEMMILCVMAVKKQRPSPPEAIVEKVNYLTVMKWFHEFKPSDRSSIHFIPITIVRKKY